MIASALNVAFNLGTWPGACIVITYAVHTTSSVLAARSPSPALTSSPNQHVKA